MLYIVDRAISGKHKMKIINIDIRVPLIRVQLFYYTDEGTQI